MAHQAPIDGCALLHGRNSFYYGREKYLSSDTHAPKRHEQKKEVCFFHATKLGNNWHFFTVAVFLLRLMNAIALF
jgi:hypothetical protein